MKHQQQNSSVFLFALFAIVLIVTYKISIWDPYFSPQPPAVPTTSATGSEATSSTGAAATAQTRSATGSKSPAAAPETEGLASAPTHEEILRNGTYFIETETLRVQLSRLGGRILQWDLAEYAQSIAKESPRLNLVQHIAQEPFPLGVYSGTENDSRVLYDLHPLEGGAEGFLYRVPADGERTFVLRGTDSTGVTIEKRLTFLGQGYRASVEVSSSDSRPLAVELVRDIHTESSMLNDNTGSSGFAWFDGNSVTREQFASAPEGVQKLGSNQWVALTDLYFSFAAIVDGEPLEMTAVRRGDTYAARLLGDSRLNFSLFGGPNSYRLLQNDPQKLDLLINFGLLRILCIPLLGLLHFFYDLFHNYGLAIVALTILVKMVTLPLTSASFKSMKAMQDVQPEVKRIKESGVDARQQQLDLMELYKKKGVNPLGGCLPIVIQLPIFIGLYTSLSHALELRHAPFALWILDLSAPEKLMVAGVGIPIMVFLLVLSMLIQQLSTPSTMDPTQKKIMLVMPLVMGFLFMGFPAGLTLYWLVSNIISIGQMSALRHGARSPSLVTAGVSALTLAVMYVITLF